jgi:tRNA pseudouridine65 synthase
MVEATLKKEAIDIVFEDDFLIAINKPNQLLVHHSHYSRNIEETSLAQMVREHCEMKIHPVHRLDRKTSGLVLFTKDPASCKAIQAQFIAQKVEKSYLALVRGHIIQNLVIETPLKNELSGEYQAAETHLKLIENVVFEKAVVPYPTARYSLVELSPKTGRTHQLRKHMNKIAHPIIGDPKHGNRHHNHAFQEWFGHSQLYLHARKLKFEHPVTSKSICLTATIPDFWQEDLIKLNFKSNLSII